MRDGGPTYGRPTPEQRLFEVAKRMSPGTVGGLVRSAAPVQRPTHVTVHRATPRGKVPTLLVAANDALYPDQADYRCDGTADEVEINAAISAIVAGPGWGRVVLTEGTYLLAASIALEYSVSLFGMGSSSYIRAGGAFNIISAIGDSQIRSLQLDGNNVGLFGIDDTDAGYLLIDGVLVSRCEVGIELNGTDGHSIVRGCQITNCSTYGVEISSPRCIVESNQLKNNDRGVHVNDDDFGVVRGNIIRGQYEFGGTGDSGINVNDTCDHILVEGNSVSGHLIGIVGSSTEGLLIQGNYCFNNQREGIQIGNGGSDMAVISNACWANSQETDNTYDNIRVGTTSATDCAVLNNICRKGGLTNKPRYGLRVDATATGTFATNNDLKNGGTTGAFSDAGTATITTAGNRT